MTRMTGRVLLVVAAFSLGLLWAAVIDAALYLVSVLA